MTVEDLGSPEAADEAEGKAAPRSPWRRAAILLSALVGLIAAGAALTARLLLHPTLVHDPEDADIATLAREVLHGHAGDLGVAQLNLYLGSSFLDPLFGALGFAVFGDRLVAWHSVGIGYGVLFAAALALLLHRVGLGTRALLPGLLLSAAPFVLLDGFVSRVGGHGTGAAWVLVALAIGATKRPPILRGLLSGVALAGACWYSRTSIVGLLPLLVLVGGGWRGPVAVCLGMGSLLAMFAATTWAVHGTGVTGTMGSWGDTFLAVAFNVWGTRAPQPVLAKLMQAASLGLDTILFAAPLGSRDNMVLERAAWLWTRAWVLAPIAAVVGGLVVRGRAGRAGIALGLLALGYEGSYALSDLSVEPGTLIPHHAPAVTDLRYLVPGWAAATAALAWALAASPRWVGGPLAVILVAAGWSAAWEDADYAAEPAAHAQLLVPFNYGPWVAPANSSRAAIHRSCDTLDPVSRANHLRALGGQSARRLGLIREEDEPLANVLQRLPWASLPDPAARAFAAEGMGKAVAEPLWSAADRAPSRTLARARSLADALPPDDARAFAMGFTARAAAFQGDLGLDLSACDADVDPDLRWCTLLAVRHITWSGTWPPPSLRACFAPDWWHALDERAWPSLALAVGLGGGSVGPTDDLDAGWPPEQEAALQRGLRRNWRSLWWIDRESWTPDTVP